jgi:hypothetical protein
VRVFTILVYYQTVGCRRIDQSAIRVKMDEEDEYLYGEGQKPRREERDPRKRKRLVRPSITIIIP